jgi:hypothetical protein
MKKNLITRQDDNKGQLSPPKVENYASPLLPREEINKEFYIKLLEVPFVESASAADNKLKLQLRWKWKEDMETTAGDKDFSTITI